MQPYEWVESDERPATSGIKYQSLGDLGAKLILQVPGLGTVHLLIKAGEVPKDLLDITKISLGS
jgi:hypothetical protein